MATAAKEETFAASSDPSVLFPLAASFPDSGVYPKTRVWGSKPENVHCSSAIGPLRTELRWRCENSSEKTAVGSGVSFKYDPFGRRIEKSSSSGTSIYAYDHENVIEETNAAGAAVARYAGTQNTDEALAMLRSGTTSYCEADGLDSVTSLSNAAGALAQTYTFDSFGNQTASSGSLTNPFQFTGREFDPESNLYYNRARYYDTQAGRFISEDPLGFGGNGTNFYAYAGNDPIDNVDPSGCGFIKCAEALAELADALKDLAQREAEHAAHGGTKCDPGQHDK
jgi:RHS repeat-associated protein